MASVAAGAASSISRTAENGIGIHVSQSLDVGYLPMCVYSSVGTPGSGDLHFVVEKFLKNYDRFVKGEELEFVVDWKKGY